MTILVRALVASDARAVARLHIETWLDTYRGLLPDRRLDGLNENDSLAMWNRILNQGDLASKTLNIGAFREGELMGFASAGQPRESWGYDSELWVINVPKRCQKQGVGRALLRTCVQHVLGRAARNMYLYCVIGNENARQFYHSLGAADTDRIKDEDGYQERAMVWNDLKALDKLLT